MYGGDGNVLLGALAVTPATSTVTVTNGAGRACRAVLRDGRRGRHRRRVVGQSRRARLNRWQRALHRDGHASAASRQSRQLVWRASATATVTISVTDTQQGDPAWSPSEVDGGFDGGRRRLRRRRRRRPRRGRLRLGQMMTLQSAPTADTTVVDALSVRRHGVAPGAPRAALAVEPGRALFDAVSVDAERRRTTSGRGTSPANATPFLNLPDPRARVEARRRSRTGARR